MTDEQLDTPGFGQYPWGLDPEIPFAGIVWWTNRELIHHLAECALLRDLWRPGPLLRGGRRRPGRWRGRRRSCRVRPLAVARYRRG